MNNRAHGTCLVHECSAMVHERERRIGARPSTMAAWGPRPTDLALSLPVREREGWAGAMPYCRCAMPLWGEVGKTDKGTSESLKPKPKTGRVQAPVARLCKSLASRRLLNSTQLNSPPLSPQRLPTSLHHSVRRRPRSLVAALLLVELALRANEPAPENTRAQKCRLRLACLQVSRWTRRSRDAE